jgi:hypothetical protein
MPTREEIAQALLIKRLRIVCLSKKLAPETYKVRVMDDGKLALVQAGRIVVMADPVTKFCYMV